MFPHLFHSSLDAVVPGQAVSDPMLPVGFINASIFVDVLSLAEWYIVLKFTLVNISVNESEKR
jgi:hypothetical protein